MSKEDFHNTMQEKKKQQVFTSPLNCFSKKNLKLEQRPEKEKNT